MTTSDAAKILGVNLYQEFSLSGYNGVLRFTETMLELKVKDEWGPTAIQELLIRGIIKKYQDGSLTVYRG